MSDKEYQRIELNEKLRGVCERFFEKQRIGCGETIYQTDRVAENALEFIEEVSDVIGFWENPNE